MKRLLFFAPLLLLLAGCGGSSAGGSSAKGKLSLTITWPERGRLIPDAANSIKLTVLSGSEEVASKVVVRPEGGSGQMHIVLGELPPVELLLKATAHPDANGSGTAQAAGSVLVSVTANATTSTSILMGSTVHHLGLAPSTTSVAFHESKTLTATAFDEANNMVLTNPARWRWEVSNGNLGIDPDGNTCTITGDTVGSASLTVRETESGKSLSKTISVTSGTGANGYTLTPLCTQGSASFFGGLNDHGDAVGWFWDTGNVNKPWVHRNGVTSPLPLNNFTNFQGGQAAGINNDGKIVGTIWAATFPTSIAVWYPGGSHRYLSHGGESNAIGIGQQGQLLGAYRATWIDQFGPTVWADDDAQPVVYGATNGGMSMAVNEQGVVAYTYRQDIYFGRIETTPPQDLQGVGTSSVVMVRARSGNKTVGTVGGQVAVWTGAALTTLGLGNGEGINADGMVVGNSGTGAGFVWSEATGFVDLLGKTSNASGWTALNPQSINANGQIAGTGLFNGQPRAFLLTPN